MRFIWTMQKKEFAMLNTLLSATTVVLFGLLCIIYPLGRIRCSKGSREECRKDIDRFLRRIHKKLGIWIIAVSLLHGIARSKAGDLEGMVSGKICFLFLILLFAGYGLKRFLKEKWMPVHRLLAVFAGIAVMIHIGGTL